MVEFYVASNFVLQWRRWMTASYTSRWLMHSMHYKLALERPVRLDSPTTRTSASPRTSAASSSGTGIGSNSGNVGIYNYTIQAISSATNLVSFSIILWGISAA